MTNPARSLLHQSERVCLVCGLLDSEGGCDHRDACKRGAEVVHPCDDDPTRQVAQQIAELSGGTVVEYEHHYTIITPKEKK